MMTTILTGDCRDILPTLESRSVQCVVTSPPYFGLRDYGVEGQIGLEPTVEAYVAEMVVVFAEVRRVLRNDGTLWLNLGSSYGPDKQLIPVPWLVALALQANGWTLRSDIIWSKPNPIPESVTDRPTKAHEYLFLLTKSPRYFYDAKAIAEPSIDNRTYPTWEERKAGGEPVRRADPGASGYVNRGSGMGRNGETRNKRSVWTIATQSTKEAHFATFPEKLVEPCILAGSRPGDTVMDPFAGSGTTMAVASRLGRHGVGIELNPTYVPMIERRTAQQSLEMVAS